MNLKCVVDDCGGRIDIDIISDDDIYRVECRKCKQIYEGEASEELDFHLFIESMKDENGNIPVTKENMEKIQKLSFAAPAANKIYSDFEKVMKKYGKAIKNLGSR